MGILGWQLFILITIVMAGRLRNGAVVFWVIWTMLQVFSLPLSLLQFGTIWLGHTIAAALFPNRPSEPVVASPAPQKPQVPAAPMPTRTTASSAPKSPDTKSGQGVRHVGASEILKSTTIDFPPPPPPPPMPSVSARAKVDWMVRHQEKNETEDIRRQVRAIFREAPSVGGPLLKIATPATSGSAQAKAGAPTHARSSARSNTPPPDLGISKSLLEHLEMLDRSSVDMTPVDLPSASASPARTQKGACVKCNPMRSKTVSGMRYCDDCGAFVGMAH